MRSILPWVFSILLWLTAGGVQAAPAPASALPGAKPISVAGQTIGQSTASDLAAYDAKHPEMVVWTDAAYQDPVLERANVQVSDEVTVAGVRRVHVKFIFDEAQVLQAAWVQPSAKDLQRVLAALTKGADEDPADGRIRRRGGVTATLVPGDASEGAHIFLSSAAYEQRRQAARDQAAQHADTLAKIRLGLWVALGALAAFLTYGLVKSTWRKVWQFLQDARFRLADGVCALLPAWLLFEAVWGAHPVMQAGLFATRTPWAGTVWADLILVGYWLTYANAITVVRVSGWLFNGAMWHSLVAAVFVPVLTVPVLIRNAWKSPHFLGVCVLQAQVVALCLYPFGLQAWVLLPVLSLLSAGVTRLFSVGFEWGRERARALPTSARVWVGVLTGVTLWPVSLLLWLFMLAWSTIQAVLMLLLGGLARFYITIPLLLLGYFLLGDGVWAILMVLPFLPAVASVVGAGLVPTGYTALPFSEVSYNPSTGLPVYGGMGMPDVAGNMWGAPAFNPATGLPMMGGFDVGGSPFGMDMGGGGFHDPFGH